MSDVSEKVEWSRVMPSSPGYTIMRIGTEAQVSGKCLSYLYDIPLFDRIISAKDQTALTGVSITLYNAYYIIGAVIIGIT